MVLHNQANKETTAHIRDIAGFSFSKEGTLITAKNDF